MRQRRGLGGSTRNSEQVLDGCTQKLGVSRSSLARALVRASEKDLDQSNAGPLGAETFVALRIEGLESGSRMGVAT